MLRTKKNKKHRLIGGEVISVNGKTGTFGRYGQTKHTSVVYFDGGGSALVDEDEIVSLNQFGSK